MGDIQRSSSPSSSSSSSHDLHPLSYHSELWLVAEQRIQEILCTIQPALASDKKRNEVIDRIQRLIKGYYDIEVFPFGSVPLKTYLPDGDIDLTAISLKNMEEELARDVCSILECQEQDPEFQVTDVQYVQAQVKVVKCSVKNISVDISFNQMAGLCALCFLEQVDQLVGRDHLFKRSIILIKAWCFYESRILGAHHGLISTYALEVLVLYIINLFHSSLPGPLAVLHRFLEYYSTFDWDNYCVSINGPIAISSLPEIVGKDDLSENYGSKLLISQEFLRNCSEVLSAPIKAVELGGHEFPVKHLNIMDPLKGSNNLGRSVNKGNFHRIRCALSYGAQRLGEVLMLPGESLGAGLERFFSNTLDRNGRGERPDAQVPVPAFGTGRSEASDLNGDYDNYYNGLLHGQWYHNYTLPVYHQPSLPLSPSQTHQRTAMDPFSKLPQCKKNVSSRKGTDVFVPRVLLCNPYTYSVYASATGDGKIGKSRGTGTYIPDMKHNPYRDSLSWMRTRNQVLRSRSPVLELPRKTDQVESFLQTEKRRGGYYLDLSPDSSTPKTEKSYNSNNLDLSIDQFPHLPCSKSSMSADSGGDNNCFDVQLDEFSPETMKNRNESGLDLSLEQFPFLPCIKKSMSLETCQSCQPILKSLQGTKNHCNSLDFIEFGSFGHLPAIGLPSLARKPVDTVSTTLETRPAGQKLCTQKQHELFKRSKEMFYEQEYQLKNEDFPPLCQ